MEKKSLRIKKKILDIFCQFLNKFNLFIIFQILISLKKYIMNRVKWLLKNVDYKFHFVSTIM